VKGVSASVLCLQAPVEADVPCVCEIKITRLRIERPE
jgi:hypothetical protein